jgi:SAM-dependent methyltransferase
MSTLYSEDDIRRTYEELLWHKRSRDIIQEYALNRKDVRMEALDGLDLSWASNVMDLGCGYGFFTEALEGRLHEDALVIGVDVVDHRNREAFLDTVTCMGYRGVFIEAAADIIRDMETGRFDVVLASYSLYFFPHLIGEIARILKDRGVFVAVTHSERTLEELIAFVWRSMREARIQRTDELRISRLFREFSVEGGRDMLEPFFRHVECIPYENSLAFPLDRFDAFIDYLDTKKHLLLKEVSEMGRDAFDEVMAQLVRALFDHARSHGKVLVTKDDGIFRCRYPVRGVT